MEFRERYILSVIQKIKIYFEDQKGKNKFYIIGSLTLLLPSFLLISLFVCIDGCVSLIFLWLYKVQRDLVILYWPTNRHGVSNHFSWGTVFNFYLFVLLSFGGFFVQLFAFCFSGGGTKEWTHRHATTELHSQPFLFLICFCFETEFC